MNWAFYVAIAFVVVGMLIDVVMLIAAEERPNQPDNWGDLLALVFYTIIFGGVAAVFAIIGLCIRYL